MELSQLRYFCKACEMGSISDAARELCIVEQTASSSIIRLERELGCTLLERNRHGVTPTSAGKLVQARATEILRLVDAMPGEVRRIAQDEERRVVRLAFTTDSLTSGPGRPGQLSTSAFDLFMQQCPGVKVELTEGPWDRCLQMVLDGIVDLAFVPGKPNEQDFVSYYVREGSAVFVFSDKHPLAARNAISFADLAGETILTPPDTGFTLEAIKNRCRSYGYEPRFKTVSMRFYFDAAARGEGFASVPTEHPDIMNTPGLVARPLVPQDDFTVPLYLAARRSVDMSEPARMLLDWMLQQWRTPAGTGTPEETSQEGSPAPTVSAD